MVKKKTDQSNIHSLWTSIPADWKKQSFAISLSKSISLDSYKEELEKEKKRIDKKLRDGDVPLTDAHLSKIIV